MKLFVILLGLLHPIHCFAQLIRPNTRQKARADCSRSNLNLNALKRYQTGHAKILTVWAAINLVAGGTSMFFSQGEAHQFHHMNAAWGSINLVVAGVLWHKAQQITPNLRLKALAIKSRNFRRFLIANIGLDLSFIAIGFWLHQGQSQSAEVLDLYRGFGNSVMLQGAGLLTLDTSSLLLYTSRLKRGGKKTRQIEQHRDTVSP